MQAFALEAFRELSARWIWPALLHSVWIGLVAASLAALLIEAGANLSHRARHAILMAGLALVVAGPVVATALQHAIAILSPVERTSAWEITALTGSSGAAITSDGAERSPMPAARVERPRSRALLDFRDRLASFVAIATQVRPFLVAVWLLCVLSIAGCLLLGARTVRRLCCEAEPAADGIQRKARAIARRLRLASVPPVLVHGRVEEPFLGGVLRPAILLPGRAIAGMRSDCLDAVLAHELAHARRLDHIINLAQRIVEMFLFFHPAVHWLSRSLRRQREFCADALAVRLTNDPLALAGALEAVALLRLSSRPAPAGASTLGGHSTFLLPRIQELLGMKPSRTRFRFWPFAAVPAAGLFALFAASAGGADGRPGPSSPPPSIVAKPSASGDSKQMISYEVRWFSSPDAQQWRELLQDRLKLVSQEADVCAWIVDDKAILDLLNLTMEQSWVNVLQAPKAVGPENATVTIENVAKQSYVARVEKLEHLGTPSFRPIVKDIDVGVRLEMNGMLLDGGTKLAVKLHDSDLLAMHTLHRRDHSGGKRVAAEYQVPTPVERRCQTACEIPEGSSLLISVGMRERRGRSSDAAETASELLEFVGLPPLPARSVTCERLVSIRPRRVMRSPEEASTPKRADSIKIERTLPLSHARP
jgi:bla regulator protein blaR1